MIRLNTNENRHSRLVRRIAPECTLFLRSSGAFPLKEPCRAALFGNGARNTLRGGTGSGDVYSRFSFSMEDGLVKAGFSVTTEQWLDAYDAVRAKKKEEWKEELKKNNKGMGALLLMMGAVMPEPDYDLPLDYPGDLAIYVLSRISGEGNDRRPVPGDVKLSETEIRDINYLQDHYDRFLLVLNTGGVVDLTGLEGVKDILLFSQLGAMSGLVLADLLLGRSYPSGKLSATWAACEDYCGIGDFGEEDDTAYREGIYVGYRYFDSVGKAPAFPFGFGLSYTTFAIGKEEASIEGKRIRVSAEVTNTGSFRGKEVVQVYVSVPEGKLDQPAQALAAFAKTGELAPGESCRVLLSFDLDELASYDTETASYILEEGSYGIRVGNSSRNTRLIGRVVLPETVIVRRARNVLGDCGFSDWKPGPEARARIMDREEAEDGTMAGVPVLAADPAAFETEEVLYGRLYETDPFAESLTDEELCRIGIGSFGKSPLSIIGNQSLKVAGAAGDFTNALLDKGFPTIVTADGPAGLRIARRYVIDKKGRIQALGNDMKALFADVMTKPLELLLTLTERKARRGEQVYTQDCTMIPIATALAQSFNVRAARKLGVIVGTEMEAFGVDYWLAPAMNIHRNILCGRNFEYYSEDPLLSGKMAAALTRGVQSRPGCGVTVKHYAANNQERNRYGNNSLVSERAMREIYLKGFGICVREGAPEAFMTSYNLLNGTHTSEHRGLIEDILRAEFGFKGIVMTDWIIDMMHKECKYPAPLSYKIAAAGGDVVMPGSKAQYEDLLKALKEGKVTRKQLEINATRMYRAAIRLTKAREKGQE